MRIFWVINQHIAINLLFQSLIGINLEPGHILPEILAIEADNSRLSIATHNVLVRGLFGKLR